MTAIDQTPAFLGMCSECLQSKVFRTERERDLWERFHTHDQGGAA